MITDENLMPIGRYKGCKMMDVPATYLLFMLEEGYVGRKTEVGQYIAANLETLRLQAKNENKGIR